MFRIFKISMFSLHLIWKFLTIVTLVSCVVDVVNSASYSYDCSFNLTSGSGYCCQGSQNIECTNNVCQGSCSEPCSSKNCDEYESKFVNGYLIHNFYSDSSCLNLINIAAFKLNTCFLSNKNGYTKLTSGTSDYTVNSTRSYFSDSECTVSAATLISSKSFVSPLQCTKDNDGSGLIYTRSSIETAANFPDDNGIIIR